MKREETVIEKGGSLFAEGYNCAQSVLLAMQDFWNIEAPLEPKTVSALGGGIGGRGSLCGALTGGAIAIGLKYGSNKPIEKERREAYNMALEFYNRFMKENSSVFCRELIGYDLTKPEELKEAWKSGIFVSICLQLVECAIRILIDLESERG